MPGLKTTASDAFLLTGFHSL